MKIFLIGFMGCGKTTLGRKLSKGLDYEFVDLDELIESKAGMTIARYFENFGEAAFRDLEKTTLQDTPFPENAVISTGGGTPCFSGNMDWMNNQGITVYLSLPPAALADRLVRGKAKRPLIKDLSQEELVKYITTKLAERIEYYTQAQHTLISIDLTAEKFLEAVPVEKQ